MSEELTGGSDHDQCQGCGHFVSITQRRIWGGNDGKMHACPHCVTYSELAAGAAATPDYNPGDLTTHLKGGLQ